MIKKILIGVATVLIALASWFTGHMNSTSTGNGVQQNTFTSVSTSSQVLLTTTSIRLIATSSSRVAMMFTPGAGCAQGAWIAFANDATAATTNSTFVASSTRYEVNFDAFPYQGSVTAVAQAGTCTLNVVAKQ